MTSPPCAVLDCPALAIRASSYCAVHDAMTAHELTMACQAAEAKRELPRLVPVTDRLEREREP